MHMARRALAHSDFGKRTVTAIAVEHGFGELGRFSVRYRKLFGEMPSETLRRASDEPWQIPMGATRGPRDRGRQPLGKSFVEQ
jgi:AraC-like DNA-binding protein